MTDNAGKLNVRFIVLLLWLLLAFFYGNLAYDYIIASNKDKALEDYLQYVVVLCGDDRRPAKEVRSLVQNKIDELKLDIQPDQLGITGTGPKLQVAVTYEVDIKLPIMHRTIYRKVFQHSVTYRNIR